MDIYTCMCICMYRTTTQSDRGMIRLCIRGCRRVLQKQAVLRVRKMREYGGAIQLHVGVCIWLKDSCVLW